jgi:hypothetical protein
MDSKKAASKRRRDKKRLAAQAENGTPGLKAVHLKRQAEAMANAIQLDVDVGDLEHSKPAWIGSRAAETLHEDGMAGRIYSAEEIFALVGKHGMRYINWGGRYAFRFPSPFIQSH